MEGTVLETLEAYIAFNPVRRIEKQMLSAAHR